MSKPHVLNDFFPESGEDKATVAGILLQMGYKLPEGSLSALETDLTELGVDAFVAEIPEGTGVRQKATFQRFLKALVGGEKIQSSEVSPFWGNVYVEGTVYNRQNEGQGSLHCNSMEDCYISWERQSGKRFANGDPYPMRRSLKVASFDAATRTFTYILNIPEGIELHGSRPSKANPRRHGQGPWFPPACRIEKTAVFSEDFSTMVSHKIKEYNHAGVLQFESDTELFVQRPPALTQLAKSMSPILGSAYVRGPVFVASREGFASFHFDSFYHCYISCAVAPSAWKLDDGLQVPVKNVFDEVSFDPATQLFRGVIKFDRIVLGASRREYTMIFSEDFLSIDSGTVQDLDAQDTVVARRYLGPSHDLSYVRKPSTVTTSGGGGAGASQHRPRLLPNVPLPDEQPYRPNGGLIYLHNQYKESGQNIELKVSVSVLPEIRSQSGMKYPDDAVLDMAFGYKLSPGGNATLRLFAGACVEVQAGSEEPTRIDVDGLDYGSHVTLKCGVLRAGEVMGKSVAKALLAQLVFFCLPGAFFVFLLLFMCENFVFGVVARTEPPRPAPKAGPPPEVEYPEWDAVAEAQAVMGEPRRTADLLRKHLGEGALVDWQGRFAESNANATDDAAEATNAASNGVSNEVTNEVGVDLEAGDSHAPCPGMVNS